MNPQQNKRTVFLIVGLVDTILGGVTLLLYFGLLPVDISNWDIPRWVIGVIGGVWFLSGFGVLVYQLTRTDGLE
ncbi:MAG: hypothetical protein ACOYZ8_14350 [Chloroflexota bacterium]